MNITQAIEIAKENYPDAELYSCSETDNLFIFAYDITCANSCSIVVEKSTRNCSIVHFRNLLYEKRISTTDLKWAYLRHNELDWCVRGFVI